MTARDVRNALRILGDHPEDIANSLREQGIKGRQGRCRTCPIARYLQRYDLDVEVSAHEITVHTPGEAFRVGTVYARHHYTIITPPWIEKFVVAFDAGHYPDLEEHDEE